MPGVSYLSNYLQLNLDGGPLGFLRSADGGGVMADVIVTTVGGSSLPKKQLGPPRYQPLEIEADLSLGYGMYEWIASFLAGRPQRKSGSIVTCDYNFGSIAERQFTNALISEVSFPALDGSSKDPAYLAITLVPESTQYVDGSGKAVTRTPGTTHKVWLPSNFRLRIDDLDCSKVSRIAAFTVKQPIGAASGTARLPSLQPDPLEIPNLKVTFSASSARSWIDWHEDFVVRSHNTGDRERNGSITYMSPDLQTELAWITLSNMGIFRLDVDFAAPSATEPRCCTAELYCERMEFHKPK